MTNLRVSLLIVVCLSVLIGVHVFGCLYTVGCLSCLTFAALHMNFKISELNLFATTKLTFDWMLSDESLEYNVRLN